MMDALRPIPVKDKVLGRGAVGDSEFSSVPVGVIARKFRVSRLATRLAEDMADPLL